MAGDYGYMLNNPGVDIYKNYSYTNQTPSKTPSKKEQIIAIHKENLAKNKQILDDDKNLYNNNNQVLDNNNQVLDNNNQVLDNNNQVQYQPSQDIAFEMSSNPSLDKEKLLKKFLNQRENNVLPIEDIKNYFKNIVLTSTINGYIQTINSVAKQRYLDKNSMCETISTMLQNLNDILSRGSTRLGKSWFSSSKDAHTNNTMAAKELLNFYTQLLQVIGMDENGETIDDNSLYGRYKNYVTRAVIGNNNNDNGEFDYKISPRIYKTLDFFNAILRQVFGLPPTCGTSNGGRKSNKKGKSRNFRKSKKSRKSNKKGTSRKSRK